MKGLINALIAQISEWGPKVGRLNYIWRTVQRQVTKRVLKRNMFLKLPNGRLIELPRSTAFSSVAWVTRGLVDDGCETVLHGLHPRNMAFGDVGAHIGFYSIWMADVASKVYAFEPDPRLQSDLFRNLKACPECEMVPCALTSESGKVRFLQADSAPYSKIPSGSDGDPAGQSIEVDAWSLDEFWDQMGHPHFGSMKIDTEGHETAVFFGGKRCLAECRPLILVETDAAELKNYWPVFEPLGYRIGLLSKRIFGRSTQYMFGVPDVVPFTQGMLFLIPAGITESQFKDQVDGLQ